MNRNQKALKIGTILLILLAVFYLIIRFALFSMLGSYDWVRIMTLISAGLICLFAIQGNFFSATATTFGYLISYLLAYLFHTVSTDPGGGRITNTWFLWSVIQLVIVVLSVLLSRIRIRRK